MIDSKYSIITTKFDRLSHIQMIKTRSRTDVESIEHSIAETFNFGIPFDKMIVLNPGDDFTPMNKKKG